MDTTISFEDAQGTPPAAPQGQPTPAATAPGTISFEEAAKPSTAPPPGQQKQYTGLFANLGAGTSEATAAFLGLPVDIVSGAINAGVRGFGSVFGTQAPQITNPVGGSDWWKSAFGYVGADPRTVAPANQAEQIARSGGLGLASTVLPGAAARALRMAAGIPGAIQGALASGATPSGAAIGTAAGAGGQFVANQVPDPYKPLANIGGQLLVGGLTALPFGLGRVAVNAVAPKVADYLAPLTAGGQERLAAGRILGAATDPAEVQARLGEQAPPLVPGSLPTTFQATEDQGLGNLERVVAKNAPDVWMGRLGEQNQARVNQLNGMAPATASPDAVGGFFRQQLSDIDAAHTAQIDGARTAAREAVNGLGGGGPLGEPNAASVLQGFGQRLRGGLAALNNATRVQVSRLYQAVDPDNSLTLDMAPIRQTGNDIAGQWPANAAPLAGEPGAIFRTVQGLPDTQLFGEAAALRSRVTDAMRSELYDNGRSQTYRALTQLLKGVDDTLSGGVAQRQASEANAVQAGQMTPEQTMFARLQQEANDYFARTRGGPAAAGAGPNAAGGLGGVSGLGGAAQPGGPGTARGPGGVAPAPTVGVAAPTFDAAAAERYRAANAAHAQRVATYDEAPGVGAVLGTGRRAGEWRLGDSQVAANLFNSGKGAAERAQAFLRAGGSNSALVADLRDYAAFSFRHAAEEADGTINPTRAERWLRAHDEALSVFPQLRAAFNDTVQRRALMDDAITRHVAAREAIETSAARRFLGDADPVITMGRILRSDTADATMRQLAQMTATNPAARAGLQRAAVDFITQELRSNTVVGEERLLKPDAFTRFVQRSSGALGHIFSPEQVEAIRNVATDLQRSQRSVTGTKLPGGSNTAQDVAAGHTHAGGSPSTIGMLAVMEGAGEGLHHFIGPFGKVASLIGVPIVNAMRQNGLHSVNELVQEAMMHPEVARTLLAKFPTTERAAVFRARLVANQLRAVALNSSLQQAVQPRPAEPPPPSPYGLATPASVPRASAYPFSMVPR